MTRRVAALGLLALTLCCGGCVYLRLLELKHQLADFDRHFTVDLRDGLKLNCLHPVLLMDDIRWLGFQAATKKKIGAAEQWHLAWIKQPPPGVDEKGHYQIGFDLVFTEGRLSGLSVAESYFAMLPKELALAMLKSLGGAEVDEKQRTAHSDVSLDARAAPKSWPTRASIAGMLGAATEETTVGDEIRARYLCVSAAPKDPAHPAKRGDIDLRLTFDAATGKLRRSQARTPVGNIDLDFAAPLKSAP